MGNFSWLWMLTLCVRVCVCVCCVLRFFKHGAHHRIYAILKDKIVTNFKLLEKNEGMGEVKKTIQERKYMWKRTHSSNASLLNLSGYSMVYLTSDKEDQRNLYRFAVHFNIYKVESLALTTAKSTHTHVHHTYDVLPHHHITYNDVVFTEF